MLELSRRLTYELARSGYEVASGVRELGRFKWMSGSQVNPLIEDTNLIGWTERPELIDRRYPLWGIHERPFPGYSILEAHGDRIIGDSHTHPSYHCPPTRPSRPADFPAGTPEHGHDDLSVLKRLESELGRPCYGLILGISLRSVSALAFAADFATKARLRYATHHARGPPDHSEAAARLEELQALRLQYGYRSRRDTSRVLTRLAKEYVQDAEKNLILYDSSGNLVDFVIV